MEGRLPFHEAAAHSSSEEMIECLTVAWSHALGEKSAVDGGALPLHLAAGRMRPNAQVIKFLAARHPPALLEADDADGSLPIHRAAAAKTESVDALQVLVKLCSRSVRAKDKQGRLPLHLVAGRSTANLGRARFLAEAWPSGIMQMDAQGQLPLHAAAKRGAPVEVVRYLFRKYPRALLEPDARGFLPIHWAANANGGDSCTTPRGLEVVRFLVQEYRQGLRSTASYRGVSLEHLAAHDEATPEVLQSFSEELPHDLRMPWSTTAAAGGGWLASVKLAFHDLIDTVTFLGLTLTEPLTLHLPCSAPDDPLPLHVAAHRATSLEIVQYLASEDPSALYKRDSNGCLPIHRAARRSTMMDHAPTATTKAIVRFLADAYPRGLLEASECGWLPLHLAVAGATSLDLVQLSTFCVYSLFCLLFI
jgi:Ankyrin repeats (3 copies)